MLTKSVERCLRLGTASASIVVASILSSLTTNALPVARGFASASLLSSGTRRSDSDTNGIGVAKAAFVRTVSMHTYIDGRTNGSWRIPCTCCEGWNGFNEEIEFFKHLSTGRDLQPLKDDYCTTHVGERIFSSKL